MFWLSLALLLCVVASTAIKPSIQFGGAPAIPPMLPQPENWDGIAASIEQNHSAPTCESSR
jgi:hypothetical protein